MIRHLVFVTVFKKLKNKFFLSILIFDAMHNINILYALKCLKYINILMNFI